MKTVILSIRGTSGSGKSHTPHTMLKTFPNETLLDENGKILGYKVDASSAGVVQPIFIAGPYKTVCGGADQIPEQQMAGDRCLWLNSLGGHVLVEGLLQSAAGPKGALTKTIYENGNAVFGIMDTPIDLCLERIRARRLAKGNDKPLNEKNSRDKWTQTMSTAKTLHGLGYDVRPIRHTNAFEDVMAIFQGAERD